MLEKLMQTVERLILALIILSLLPCLVGALIHAIGTFNLLLVLGVLSVTAYLRHGSRAPSAARRKTAGAERTPLLPKGDD